MQITPLEKWMARRIDPHHQKLTRKKIEAHQLDKLRETIQWARTHNSFYRERLGALTENDLPDLRDLARFPFTTPRDISKDPLRLLCVSQSEIKRVVTLQTSGTTGDPKRIYFTEADQETTLDFFHHAISTLAAAGDRVMILLPGERPGSVGDLAVTALDRLGAIGVPHGLVRDPVQTLDIMKRERIDVLVGIPTQVLSLARHGNAAAAPGSVLLCTDHVPDAITHELQQLWGCEVYNYYGMTEMGLGGGVECGAHFGYHLQELDFYVEIIDPRTGEPLAEGQRGEVVFSTLTRRGMPLIRYRTGDFSRFLPGPCPCGTILRSLEKVKGRISGEIQLAGGQTVNMAQLDEALFALDGLLDFNAGLSREGAGDLLHIEACAMDNHNGALGKEIYKALERVQSLGTALNENAIKFRINIRSPAAIPVHRAAKRTIADRRPAKRNRGMVL